MYLGKRFLAVGLVVAALFAIIGSAVSVSAETLPLQPTTATADYQLVFASSWSTATHPSPSFPTSTAHYSPLAGATHTDDYTVWSEGSLASSAVETLAELGVNGPLVSELGAASDVGETFTGAFQWAWDPVTVTFSADNDHHYVSFLTMIAPSPDWFVGVDSVNLQTADGDWYNTIEITVYPYDAGTEEGEGYSLSNPATDPPQPITNISGQGVFSAEPLGTFTFTRTDISFTEALYMPILSNR